MATPGLTDIGEDTGWEAQLASRAETEAELRGKDTDPHQADMDAALAEKPLAPQQASVSCNNCIDIASRITQKDRPPPRVTVLREAQSCGFLSGIYCSASAHAIYRLGVISTTWNVA